MAIENQSRISIDTQAFLPSHGFKWLYVSGLNSLWIGVIFFSMVMGIFILMETMLARNQFPTELKWVVASMGAVFLTIWLALTRGAVKDLQDIANYGGPIFSKLIPLVADLRHFPVEWSCWSV